MERRAPGRRLASVGGLALALIVVAALAAAILGQPPEDGAAVPADDVAVPGRPDEPASDAVTAAAPAASPHVGAGAMPFADARVECSRSDDVTAAPCVSWSVQLDRFPTTGAVVAGRTLAIGARPDVVGLDTRTGEARWRTEIGRVVGVTVARDGTAFVAWTDVGEVVVLEPFGGRVVWQAPVSPGVADAALVQGWVVVATASGVHAWPIDGHAKEWHVTVSGQPSPLGVGDGVVAVGDGQGDVRLIDVDTGTIRWSVPTDTWYTSVTPDGRMILTAGFGSPLTALDVRAGEIAWESPEVAGWVVTEVLHGTGRAVAQAGGSDTLFLVDLATGALVAEEPGLGDLLGTSIDGWGLVHTGDRILAYDAERADGSIGWAVHLDGQLVGAPKLAYPGASNAPLLVVVAADGRVVATPVPPRVP